MLLLATWELKAFAQQALQFAQERDHQRALSETTMAAKRRSGVGKYEGRMTLTETASAILHREAERGPLLVTMGGRAVDLSMTW